MGSAQSNATKQILSDYTNVVNSTVTNVYSNASSSCGAINNFSLETGKDCPFEMINGTFDIGQTAGTKCNLDSKNVTDLSATFLTQLTNNTKQFIEQNEQNKQGWFATAFSLQIQDAANVQQVMSLISNSFSLNFTSLCSSVANAFNNATVNLCGYFNHTTFNFQQNAFVTALTSCVNQNVINIWTSNAILNNLSQKTDQKLLSEQSGVDFTRIFIIIGIIVAILLIGGIIIAVVKSKSGKGAQKIPYAQTAIAHKSKL